MRVYDIKLVLPLLLSILLVSCGSSLRESMLEEHPEWPDKYVQLIKRGEIAEGMSKDMVRAAWGPPKQNSAVNEKSYHNRWIYETATTTSYSATYVYFKNDEVVNIDQAN